VSGGYVDQANPQPLPRTALGIAGILAVIGVLCFGYGLASDPETAWRAFHVNYLYWGAIAQGGLAVAATFVIVGAKWPGPVRRIAESLAAWVPVTLLLGIVGIAGKDYIYPWIAEPLPWKEAWLNTTRMYATDLGVLALLTFLTFLFLKASLRPTLKAAEADAQGFAKSMIGSWTSGWKGDAEEQAESDRKTRFLAPIIALAFAFGWTILAFDQVMSLEPTWFSNLFGGFFTWGGFLGAISLTTLLAVLYRNHPGLEGQISKDRLHDLGKMIFAFSIFWMYLFFSQYIVIWYGNLPEETQFFTDRLGSEFVMSTWYWEGWAGRVLGSPWAPITLFAWICIWVIPFWFLLGAKPKKTWWFVGPVALVSVFGFWIERNVLIWPSLAPDERWAFLGVIQIGTALGFLGLFGLVHLAFTHVFPTLAVPRK
jgi:hypothetical protein